MKETYCKNCQHYLQHYAIRDQQIFRVHCGHCIFSGAKRKMPDTPACGNFLPGPADDDAFVKKEYLTKKLLEHFLSLELLPEIGDLPRG